MKRECFKSRCPIARKLLIISGIAATVAIGALVVPRLADRFSDRMIKNSGSIEIPNEGPEIVRNDSAEDR